MPDTMSDRMSDRMPERMPDTMTEYMPDRMSEYMSNRLRDRMPEHMSDRVPEWIECQNICQINCPNISNIYVQIYILKCHGGDHTKYFFTTNVVKTIINHPISDGLYHLFMVIWGMVYYCFNHIKNDCVLLPLLYDTRSY